MKNDTYSKIAAEFIGSAFLIMIIVGSGIMGEKLSGGNVAIALLANAIATAAGLFFLISILGPISGAHFNPLVSLYERIRGNLVNTTLLGYISAQLAGGLLGVFTTHYIFELPIFQISQHNRDGMPLFVSEIIATLGLILTIAGFTKFQPEKTATGVALYILSAYWFTSSTSFANPMVTLARSLTNTFAGIAPHSLLGFVLAQCLGLFLFLIIERLVFKNK